MAAMASDSAPTEDQLNQIEQHFNMILNEDDDAYLESTSTRGEQDDHDDEEDDDEDCEFSFVCEQSNSPIAADDIFEDGQIRPLFHFVLHDSSADHDDTKPSSSPSPVRKVFISRTDLSEETAAEGPACAWDKSNLNAEEPSASSSVPEICKKSNSTGFSKLFRFRDMLLRSYSDGRDAFVFLANHKREDKHETTTTTATITTITATTASSQKEKASTKEREKSSVPGKGTKKTASYVMLYGRKKTGEAARRKSYLPYRQDLVGFFTNVNGMSRNVHPY